MELPKDIIQIGEANPNCKVYVEDYAVSFLKQQNRQAVDKEITTALFGRSKNEDGKLYVFVYGAALIGTLHKEVRHLSQAQNQEIEKLRKRYFPEYELVGYRILNGEMIEGMHVCEKDTFRYIAGYAQFYEKNDIMLNYMLEYKGETVQPEIIDQEKYEMVRKRQEERRNKNDGARKKYESEKERISREEERNPAEQDGISSQERDELKETWNGVLRKQRQGLRRLQLATVAVFVVLCIVGIYSLGMPAETEDDEVNGIPVAGPAEGYGSENISVIRTDEKLTEALLEENLKENEELGEKADSTDGNVSTTGDGETDASGEITGGMDEKDTTGQDDGSGQGDAGNEDIQDERTKDAEIAESEEMEAMPQEAGGSRMEENVDAGTVKEPVIYVIQKGDTLLGISLRVYGNTTMMMELCKVNQISNPDDIKVGQKIKLP